MFSVNVTISDINLETGSVPKYVNIFKIATCSKTGLTLKKGLNISITDYSLVSNKIINIFIFFASLRTVLRESSIYTRNIFRNTRIFKNLFRGFGPDVTLSVSYRPNHGLELIPTELVCTVQQCTCIVHLDPCWSYSAQYIGYIRKMALTRKTA